MKRSFLIFLLFVGFLSQAQMSAVPSYDSIPLTNDEVKSKVEISPNPSTGIVHIDFRGESVQELAIVNAQGQEVFKQVVGKAISVTLNLKFLKKGMYFVVFDGSIGTKMELLIVN